MIDTHSSRQAILQKLQHATAAEPNKTDRLKPKQGQLHRFTAIERLELFTRVLTAHNTTVTNLETITDLPAAVQAYLQTLARQPIVFGGNNPLFNTLDWPRHGLQWREENFSDDGQVAIANADYGIADTGTVVILSSDKNPTRNNFLAEHHIVVIKRETIVPYSEDVWERLLRERSPLPRAINFISGPSSSADVGLKLEYGAHGPRTLGVFVY